MQVTETLNEGLKRAYTITVTAAELDAKVQEKLVEAQPEVEMKGFRKGKVPMAMLRKQFGAMVASSAGLYAAQKLLGHSSPDLTSRIYADLISLPEPLSSNQVFCQVSRNEPPAVQPGSQPREGYNA